VRSVMASTGPNRHSLIIVAVFSLLSLFSSMLLSNLFA
jgi:hypothetical protein